MRKWLKANGRLKAMEKEAVGSISEHFGELQDPRTGNAKAHIFLEILIIAICAVICGADGWSDIELFGKNKKDWLKTFLELPKGIPSHDTFGRVFAKIKPEEFQKRFIEWVQAIEKLTAGQVSCGWQEITPFTRSAGWQRSDLHGECLGNPKSACSRADQSCRQVK
jgi:hypothetical protein